MKDTTFEFDVFISYSHKDTTWVNSTLIPQLKSFGVNYAIDYKDFAPGKAFTSEMFRLIKASRQTLIVITPDWIASNFTDFEAQLTRAMDPQSRSARLIPLRVKACEVPIQLSNIVLIDMTTASENTAWQKLHRALLDAKTTAVEQNMFSAEMKLWKHYSSPYGSDRSGSGYQYLVELLISNSVPAGPPLLFDTIVLSTVVPELAGVQHGVANAVSISILQSGILAQRFSYDQSGFPEFSMPHSGGKYDPPKTIKLGSGRGLKLPGLGLGTLRQSIAGRESIGLSVSLFLGNNQVTSKCWCVLPPLSRLRLTDSGEGFHVYLISDQFMSPASGILDSDLLHRIFETAGNFVNDSLLLRVTPRLFTVHEMLGGDHLHTVQNWRLEFFSEAKNGTFDIDPEDPTWIDEDAMGALPPKPKTWLSENLLLTCRIDGNIAYLIALETGCEETVKVREDIKILVLEPIMLEGVWRPVWQVPLRFKENTVAILADTGELVVYSEKAWNKPPSVIWNS